MTVPILEVPLSPRSRYLEDVKMELYPLEEELVSAYIIRHSQVNQQPLVPLLNPAPVLRRKGRPVGFRNRSNQPERSQHEHVAGETECGKCTIQEPVINKEANKHYLFFFLEYDWFKSGRVGSLVLLIINYLKEE